MAKHLFDGKFFFKYYKLLSFIAKELPKASLKSDSFHSNTKIVYRTPKINKTQNAVKRDSYLIRSSTKEQ